MSKASIIAACIAAGCLLGTAAVAHHSTSLWYDMARTVQYTGEFVELRWINPHSVLKFEVTAPDGTKQMWQAETHGPAALAREGWRPKQFTPGEKLVVVGNPSRKGTNTLSLLKVTEPSGKTFSVNPSN